LLLASCAQVWRDAYTLYMLLTVVAKLAVVCMPGRQTHVAAAAAAELPVHEMATPPVHQQQQQQQLDGLLSQMLPADQQQQQQQLDAVLREMLPAALKQLDLAAMMGGPQFRPLLDEAIALLDQQLLLLLGEQQGKSEAAATATAAAAAAGIGTTAHEAGGADAGGRAFQPGLGYDGRAAAEIRGSGDEGALQYAKRRRVQEPPAATADAHPAIKAPQPQQQQLLQQQRDEQQQRAEQLLQQQLPAGSLSAASAVVPVERCPSLELFMMRYLLPEGESVLLSTLNSQVINDCAMRSVHCCGLPAVL
jgi:hypothetical protein